MPQQPHSLPRSLVSVPDFSDNDQEEIEDYVKSIKRRARESSHIGDSSGTQDRSLELWTLPVPVRFFHVVLMIG